MVREVIVRAQVPEEQKEEDACSQKGEETSHHSGHSEEAAIPEVENVPRGRTSEERYGIHILQQLNQQHRELLHSTHKTFLQVLTEKAEN